jgi:large subunit ribosomal protein L20
MARVKRGVTAHARHKRLLQDAEGRKGTRSRLVKPAREAVENVIHVRERRMDARHVAPHHHMGQTARGRERLDKLLR